MIAVETRALSRIYKGRRGRPDVLALDGVSLRIEEGEVRGLLGPNGAGKTTLVRVLCTVLTPTGGSASILGHDVVTGTAAVRRLIGIVFGGDRGLYWHLSGRQNLEYWAALYEVPVRETASRVDAALARVALGERADDLVEAYSRGMKQRLHMARALVAGARVLFLDEPTAGMDPVAAREFRAIVGELRSEGRTVLLTTHDMAEAEAVCDRVALIDHGRLLAVETPQSLSRLMAAHERIDFQGGGSALVAEVRRLSGVASVDPLANGDGHRVVLADATAARGVLEQLVRAGVTSIRTSRPTLEEVYLHIIGGRRALPPDA